MDQRDSSRKARIQSYLKAFNEIPSRRQRLGALAPILGYLLIIPFAIFLLPLYLYLLFFNLVYFWVRRQRLVERQDYFDYDRHKIPHLSLADKVWCAYCEWANGSLQWALAITNEIERRYCPIKNRNHERMARPKPWRARFLGYEHSIEDLEEYYRGQYLDESDDQ